MMRKKLNLKPHTVFLPAKLVVENREAFDLLDASYFNHDVPLARKLYLARHPKGSLFCDTETDLISKTTSIQDGGRHPLPQVSEFVSYCEQAGIGRKPAVIFDAFGHGSAAARLYWMLWQLDVEAFIVNGGLPALEEAGIEMEEGKESKAPTTCVAEPFSKGSAPYSDKKEWKHIVSIEDVSAEVAGKNNNKKLIIFDARTPDRFASGPGRPQPQDPVCGTYCSSARNLSWTAFNTLPPNDPKCRVKSDEEIKEIFDKAGVKEDQGENVISVTCCGSGVTACMGIACAHHIGWKPESLKLFPGSWSHFANAKRDQLFERHIKECGFAIAFEKQNPTAASLCESSSSSSSSSSSVIKINEKEFASVSEAVSNNNNDEALREALEKHVKSGEKGVIQTAKGKYCFAS